VLYCQHNKLTTLPENLKDLKGLKVLDCYNNQLEKLPPLPEGLEKLDCSNNPNLTTLPELPESLEYLDATGCPLTEETKERIRRHKNYNPDKFKF